MHLTGDRARELLALVLSRDPPGALGGPARFAPPGTPPVLLLSIGVDPDSLAPGVDLRAGSRRARVGADLDAGPSPALLRESLSRLGAPEAGLLALGGLVLAAYETDDRDASSQWLQKLAQTDKTAADKLAFVKASDSTAARAGQAGEEELSWSE